MDLAIAAIFLEIIGTLSLWICYAKAYFFLKRNAI